MPPPRGTVLALTPSLVRSVGLVRTPSLICGVGLVRSLRLVRNPSLVRSLRLVRNLRLVSDLDLLGGISLACTSSLARNLSLTRSLGLVRSLGLIPADLSLVGSPGLSLSSQRHLASSAGSSSSGRSIDQVVPRLAGYPTTEPPQIRHGCGSSGVSSVSLAQSIPLERVTCAIGTLTPAPR